MQQCSADRGGVPLQEPGPRCQAPERNEKPKNKRKEKEKKKKWECGMGARRLRPDRAALSLWMDAARCVCGIPAPLAERLSMDAHSPERLWDHTPPRTRQRTGASQGLGPRLEKYCGGGAGRGQVTRTPSRRTVQLRPKSPTQRRASSQRALAANVAKPGGPKRAPAESAAGDCVCRASPCMASRGAPLPSSATRQHCGGHSPPCTPCTSGTSRQGHLSHHRRSVWGRHSATQ